MSYQRRLVEYVLQCTSEPVTAHAMVENLVAEAIDAGASREVVDSINAKMVAAHLRALGHAERAMVACKALDPARSRMVPCWIKHPAAALVGPPTPPPGIPAVMRSRKAEQAMDALLRAFADDAATAMVQIQGIIKGLTAKYQAEYRALKEKA